VGLNNGAKVYLYWKGERDNMEGLWRWRELITEDPVLCTQCGGLCCQSHPGMYLDPIQFQEAWDLPPGPWDMKEVLLANSLAFKVCMGVPIPVPCYTDQGCIFWSPEGCRLPRSKRPLGCLALEPKIETIIEPKFPCYCNEAGGVTPNLV
jgi:Fe-S-cluster containining protein